MKLIKKILRLIIIIISSFSLCFVTVVKNFEVKAFNSENIPFTNIDNTFHDLDSFISFMNNQLNSYYSLFLYGQNDTTFVYFNDSPFSFSFFGSLPNDRDIWVSDGDRVKGIYPDNDEDASYVEKYIGVIGSSAFKVAYVDPYHFVSDSRFASSDYTLFANYSCGLPLINQFNPNIHLKDHDEPVIPPVPDDPIDYTSYWDRLMVFCKSFEDKLKTIIDNLEDIINLIGNTGDLDDKSSNFWDFLMELLNKMIDLIGRLFNFDLLFNTVKTILNLFKNKLGFLLFPVDLFMNILNRFIVFGGGTQQSNPFDNINTDFESNPSIQNGSGTAGSGTGKITYPELTLFNVKLWESGSINVQQIFNNILGDYTSIYYNFIDFSVYMSLSYLFFKKFKQYVYDSDDSGGTML